MKKLNLLLLVLMGIVLLTGCADVSHIQNCLAPNEYTYGFWSGTWHGIIAPLAFIGSLFSDDIAIYAINNNGHWYDFGYVGGLFLFLRVIGGVIRRLSE